VVLFEYFTIKMMTEENTKQLMISFSFFTFALDQIISKNIFRTFDILLKEMTLSHNFQCNWLPFNISIEKITFRYFRNYQEFSFHLKRNNKKKEIHNVCIVLALCCCFCCCCCCCFAKSTTGKKNTFLNFYPFTG